MTFTEIAVAGVGVIAGWLIVSRLSSGAKVDRFAGAAAPDMPHDTDWRKFLQLDVTATLEDVLAAYEAHRRELDQRRPSILTKAEADVLDHHERALKAMLEAARKELQVGPG